MYYNNIADKWVTEDLQKEKNKIGISIYSINTTNTNTYIILWPYFNLELV